MIFFLLQVSSVIIPLGFASVYYTYQAVPDELCQIIGYLTVTATITSLGNLTMVAVNRWFTHFFQWEVVGFWVVVTSTVIAQLQTSFRAVIKKSSSICFFEN